MDVEAKFCITKVSDNLKESLKDEDDVYMDAYLAGYKELYKFFHLMGKVFGFVSSDVKQKVDILEEFRTKENKEKFVSFKTMMEYEKSDNLLDKKDYVSGSRTLLRLHRGLDFIREFLRQLGDLQPREKTGDCCHKAYNSTLANFHPWIIRKGVSMTVFALPTRDQLLTKVCQDVELAISNLPSTLEVMASVYDRTQNLYTKFDLHGLP